MRYEFKREDAYAFANAMGAQYKEYGQELLFRLCPMCGGGDHKDTSTFAINLRTGLCNCLRTSCGYRANFETLLKDFGKTYILGKDYEEYYKSKRRFRIFPKSKISPEKVEKPKPLAVQYLGKRGISEETVERYKISVRNDNPKIIVFPFFDEHGQLQFIKYRDTEYVKGGPGNKEFCEKDCKPILFGMYQCNPETDKTLVMTEGQIDSMSVAEAGVMNAVSVPTGAKGFTWVPYCWDWIEQFEHIVIFGDYENGKITLVDEMKHRFRDKLLIVQESDYHGCKDANEILQKCGKEAVRTAVENAKPLPILRVVDLADVEEVDVFAVEKLKTGLKSVDRLLYGGVPFGGVTIISGKPGEGKSTLASQIMIQAIENGYQCFAYSGELPNGVFKGWMNFQVAGPAHIFTYQNKFGDENFNISETNRKIISEWYRGKIEIYDHSMLDEDLPETESLIKTCEQVILRHGAQVILIDNLMTAIDLEEGKGSDKYERQAQFVKKLGRLGQRYNVLILLVAHKRKNNFSSNENDEVAGASEIVNLAMLTIAYEKNSDIGEGQRLLKISKNRLFGRTYTKGWTVDFEPKSKRIYESGKDDPRFELSWANNIFEDATEEESEIPFD